MRPKGDFEVRAGLTTPTPEDDTLAVWIGLISTYTTCSLTFEGDRLVAAAGLARRFQPFMKCRYLAGLWEYRLVQQLIWEPLSPIGVIEMAHLLVDSSANWKSRMSVENVNVLNLNDDEMSQALPGCVRIRATLFPVSIPDLSDFNATVANNIIIRNTKFKFSSDVPLRELRGRLFSTICVYKVYREVKEPFGIRDLDWGISEAQDFCGIFILFDLYVLHFECLKQGDSASIKFLKGISPIPNYPTRNAELANLPQLGQRQRREDLAAVGPGAAAWCSGAQVLFHDLILPESGTVSPLRERQIRERDEEDWRQVFREADPGFKVLHIFTPK
ncbi:hypothetical protein G7Y89_g11416 [Cudoniella acicularis]|uniref:Uncharacterized protein n=1 Tax=Cudoniella acicularis TaxID=354080 RepID=A0A8H4RD96_9HELO|nr:hypothetical protein G7Y89_g11416 [Cudoniella acicularis]